MRGFILLSDCNYLTAFYRRPTGCARCSSRAPRSLREMWHVSRSLRCSSCGCTDQLMPNTGLYVYGPEHTQLPHTTKQTTNEKHRKPRYITCGSFGRRGGVPLALLCSDCCYVLMQCFGGSVGEQHRRKCIEAFATAACLRHECGAEIGPRGFDTPQVAGVDPQELRQLSLQQQQQWPSSTFIL